MRSCGPSAFTVPRRIGQHELGRLVGDLDRAQRREAELLLLLEVHLGDEELHALLEVAAEHARRRRRGCGSRPPSARSRGRRLCLRREDQDVVLADGVPGLDRHAERLRARRLSFGRPRLGGPPRAVALVARRLLRARIRIEVLDQPRRRERVEVIDERFCRRCGSAPFSSTVGTGTTIANSLGSPWKSLAMRQHGAVAVAHQHDLRGAVEELGVASAT